MPVWVHALETALPEHSIGNEEAAARLRPYLGGDSQAQSLLEQVFANAGIERRHLARPPGFYLTETTLSARNQAYEEVARELSIAAARRALEAAGVGPSEVDIIVDTSCTGVMIPAVDVFVANALGMRPDVRRVPLTEAGCAAGATSLWLAHDLLRARGEGTALLIAVELPSLTLQLDDASRANLISAAIFGDGAAALVVSTRRPRGRGLELLAQKTVLFKDTVDLMGFDLRSEGFRIVLSQRIPHLVAQRLRGEVDAFLEAQGLSLGEMAFHAIHPGGTKVLDGVRDALGLDEEQVTSSRRVLREFGNLSSASVHFVARDLLARGKVEAGAPGLLVAMGPGFTVELGLIRGK